MSDAIKVWDMPTRLFHWLMALLFCFSWWSAETSHMDWHYKSGLTLLLLVTFRLIWGFIGGSTARFAQFVRGPRAVIAYVKGQWPQSAGHSPLAALSVFALLGLMLVQIGAGLFAVDTDGLESGPLSHYVSFDAGRQAAGLHHLVFAVLQLLVIVHLLALVYYRLAKKRRLVGPMLTGNDPQLAADVPGLVPASLGRLVLALAVAAIITTWVAKGAPF